MDHASLITDFFLKSGLGEITAPIKSVSGGFMHRMYRAETPTGTYAVKILNPEVMSRPDAMENYARAGDIEEILEQHGLPAVTVLSINGRKIHEVSGSFIQVFPWIDGKTILWRDIENSHCRAAGTLLGRMHRIARRQEKSPAPRMNIDLPALAASVKSPCPELFSALTENMPLLETALSEYNAAVESLPSVTAITNSDMDCKNVMWTDSGPRMIDLECLDWSNPMPDMVILALSWAGGDICQIDPAKIDAFLSAYAENYGPPDASPEKFYALGYSWLGWLEYSVRRAAGLLTRDPGEIKMGLDESFRTIDRIRHIAEMKDSLLPIFAKWSK